MISPKVTKRARAERWPMLPINVCARCGRDDDPQDTEHWEKDIDDHRVCPACLVACVICNDQTSGSRSVNGTFCAAICQECRDVEDKAAEMKYASYTQQVGRLFREPDTIPLTTEVVS